MGHIAFATPIIAGGYEPFRAPQGWRTGRRHRQ